MEEEPSTHGGEWSPCEIGILRGDRLSPRAVSAALFASRPVLFRGAALGRQLRHHLVRDKLLARYGAQTVRASRLPYAQEYGADAGTMISTSLATFVMSMEANRSAARENGRSRGDSRSLSALYAFE